MTSLVNPQLQLLNLQVYEDTLAAQKAAFESFVTITDPVESEKLSLYKSLLPEMEQVTIVSSVHDSQWFCVTIMLELPQSS